MNNFLEVVFHLLSVKCLKDNRSLPKNFRPADLKQMWLKIEILETALLDFWKSIFQMLVANKQRCLRLEWAFNWK